MRIFISRVLDVVFRRRREERLSEEMQAHLEMLADEHVARGLSPAEARLAARNAFGGVDQIKERYRDRRGFRAIDDLLRDVRFAARLLRREPGFVAAAGLSLAIGIGANTAIFTIANSLLFRDPPGVAEPERLVDISRRTGGDGFGVNEISFPNFLDLRERVTTIDVLCAYDPVAKAMSFAATGAAGAERVFGHSVTANYFAVLGVGPALGRLFDPLNADGTVVLSHRFWSQRFDGDASMVGRTVRINGQPVTIAGIAPEQFTGTSLVATDVWVPKSLTPPPDSYEWKRELYWALAKGRLAPGVSMAAATAEVDAVARSLELDYPEANAGMRFRLAAASRIPGNLSGPLAGVMTLTLAFVSLVLAVACANLAGLLLARASVRRREIAVRLAVGASRAQLARQLLTETLVLFAAGGVIGIGIARAATSLVAARLPSALSVPIDIDLALDTRVLLFTMGLSFIAAIACGLVPALESAKTDVIGTLRNDAPSASRPSRARNVFVVVQVALSIVLVVGAGLFSRALQKAAAADSGFDPKGVAVVDLDLSLNGMSATAGSSFFTQVVDRLRQLPQVENASVAARLPTQGRLRLGLLSLPGAAMEKGRRSLDADWNAVEPGYFDTLRIGLARGRDFNRGDSATAPPVIIVNEEAARRFWPGEDALGKLLVHSPAVAIRGQNNDSVARVVIGVVRNTRGGDSARSEVYLPLQQSFSPSVAIVARGRDAGSIAGELRGTLASLAPGLPALGVQTLDESADTSRLPRRVAAAVAAGLGAISLILATVGVYGVTAYTAARWTKEIGIRMALGATAGAIVRMVARAGFTLVVIGSAVGVAIAAAINLWMPTQLAGFPPIDPIAFVWAAAIFMSVGLLATYLPSRRAARRDPLSALRQD